MPCLNDRCSAPDDYQIVTRLACDRCREIEARGGTIPSFAKEWWKEHQDLDEKRLNEELQARKEQQIRERAISKLTKEEREELGV